MPAGVFLQLPDERRNKMRAMRRAASHPSRRCMSVERAEISCQGRDVNQPSDICALLE